MKKLGLIGGMGPQSTVPYYMNIVYGVQERTSKDFFPNLTIESLNVFEILKMIGENRLDDLTDHFLGALQNLKNAGADLAALTANTAHIVFDRLKERSPLPLVSIVEATADEAVRRGVTRLALLGTKFTMEQDFYKKPFERAGIEVVVPNKKERQYIDEKITSELEFGKVLDDTRINFARIIDRMLVEEGTTAVILGCTELPMLLNDEVSPIPCLDTVSIHSAALIEAILAD
ncbi:MAG: amino acid racemase [Muribaculaceae bacterium]|nr:amino acid racemase [Muribaculaceae bacterium]